MVRGNIVIVVLGIFNVMFVYFNFFFEIVFFCSFLVLGFIVLGKEKDCGIKRLLISISR